MSRGPVLGSRIFLRYSRLVAARKSWEIHPLPVTEEVGWGGLQRSRWRICFPWRLWWRMPSRSHRCLDIWLESPYFRKTSRRLPELLLGLCPANLSQSEWFLLISMFPCQPSELFPSSTPFQLEADPKTSCVQLWSEYLPENSSFL